MGRGAVAGIVHGRDAEVGEHDTAGAVQQDVARFDVPVQHAGAVRGAEGLEHARADAGGLPRVHHAAGVQHVVERGAVDEFHHDDRSALVLRDVVDGDDPGMPDAGGGPGLALHPHGQVGEFGRRRVGVGAQFLDGDLAPEHLVDRPPDDAHAAAAQLFDQPVTPGQPLVLPR
jgi:hypothetical protein